MEIKEVFLSHAGSDMGSQAALVQCLMEYQGISVFFDQYGGPQNSQDWAQLIERNASKCPLFIALLSPGYFQRYWPQRELQLALDAGKAHHIIPVYWGWSRETALKELKEAAKGQNSKPKFLPGALKLLEELVKIQGSDREVQYTESDKRADVKVAQQLVKDALRLLPSRVPNPEGTNMLPSVRRML